MSFQEIGITVAAQNLASSVFAQVAADAGQMSSQIIETTNSMGAGFTQVSSDVGVMGAQITSTSNSVSVLGTEFARTGTEAANLSTSARATASCLEEVGRKAEETDIQLTTVARGLGTITGFGSAVTILAGDLGLVDKQSAKWISTILAVITVVTAFARLQAFATLITTGHTASIGVNTTAQTANASSSIALAAAHGIKTAATWIATTAQNALNISQATFLALTGVGIAVIIAAAAAMAYFASQMNHATASVQNFNGTAAEVPTRARSIQRAGDSASLYRRGIE
jgi:hypothetical protein